MHVIITISGEVLHMKWEDFCERYDEWKESTLKKNIYSLEDLDTADDVVDLALALPKDFARLLIKRAYEQGAAFTPFDFGELPNLVDEDLYRKILDRYISEHEDISVDELVDLAEYLKVETADGVVRHFMEKGNIYSPEDIDKFDALVGQDVIDEMLTDAVEAGVDISAKDVIRLDGVASRSVLNRAIRRVRGRLTVSELESLEDVVDKDILIEIDKKQGTRVYYAPPVQRRRSAGPVRHKGNHKGILGLLLLPLYVIILPVKIFIDVFLFVFSSSDVKGKETGIRDGDHVWIRNYDVYGVVIDSHGHNLLVSVHDGERVYSVPRSQVTKTF